MKKSGLTMLGRITSTGSRTKKQLDKVYSFGFSYGKVDSVYIKHMVSRISPNAVWYFTTFEAKDSEALRIKKIKLRKYGFKGKFDIYEE